MKTEFGVDVGTAIEDHGETVIKTKQTGSKVTESPSPRTAGAHAQPAHRLPRLVPRGTTLTPPLVAAGRLAGAPRLSGDRGQESELRRQPPGVLPRCVPRTRPRTRSPGLAVALTRRPPPAARRPPQTRHRRSTPRRPVPSLHRRSPRGRPCSRCSTCRRAAGSQCCGPCRRNVFPPRTRMARMTPSPSHNKTYKRQCYFILQKFLFIVTIDMLHSA